jgi:hypothetical protein
MQNISDRSLVEATFCVLCSQARVQMNTELLWGPAFEPSEVGRVLQNNEFHPFHVQGVQNLLPCDYMLAMFTFVKDWTTVAHSAWQSVHW